MTATALTQSYAIGPAFHDWQYEEWSRKSDARDAAFEEFTKDWESDLISDCRNEVFNKIDETMDSVFDGIYNDAGKSDRFNRLIFKLWAGGTDCIGQIKKMIQDEMDKAVLGEFERGVDWH